MPESKVAATIVLKKLKMEILNQNQRKSAKWRLFGLSVLTLLVLLLGLISIKSNLGKIGADDLQQLQKKRLLESEKWEAERNGYNNEIEIQKKELSTCENNNLPIQMIDKVQKRLEARKKRIKALEKEIKKCEKDLATAESY